MYLHITLVTLPRCELEVRSSASGRISQCARWANHPDECMTHMAVIGELVQALVLFSDVPLEEIEETALEAWEVMTC